MITIKPIPREKAVSAIRRKRMELRNFTIHAISHGQLNKEEVAWVAQRVAHMLGGKKKGELSNKEINTAIEYIRFLLSKMQLLKTKRLTALARELFHPGDGRKTQIVSFVRPKRDRRYRIERQHMKKVAWK